jgi:hypothetical protein
MTVNIRTIEVTLASRQTPESRFSHFEGTEQELLELVFENFHQSKEGYRDGVRLVTVPFNRFKSGVVQLSEGDALQGTFETRREGEVPRKVVTTTGRLKLPAGYVEIILYRRDVLEEDPDYTATADWEVISINASPTDEALPIPPNALIANHFGMSGGTDTKYTALEFEEALRESIMFWHDKAMCG